MIAILSLFIPPLISIVIRNKILKKDTFYNNIINYAISTMFINCFMLFILYYLFNSNGNLYYKLNQYNNFAFKYILLATLTAVVEPLIEKFIKENIILHFDKIKFPKFKYWRIIIGAYGLIILLLNFVRIFNNNFWSDECFSILLMPNSISDIISKTAADVHPPLYVTR